ncbi:hypothetical protein GWO43_18055 [candidate division KSB1 bacterium]|nr:hypothetical protein [candidate division KSB1 bacterium]NIR69963.1 hypothetical protein [candidate division KSB1 bacterium]NIS25862.1 hypothetical protein [candidate division KSB1 bacterium]NIT72739.1 hypothetical protein [candidate division KSB1 bacterium]NIU26551.1 hypothetical protein [candidate division KSB1 bacterium]
MVTTVGFQDGTLKSAKGRGIALALLTKEHQNGEIDYVVNTAVQLRRPQQHDGFWQGNFRGPLGIYDGGFRFENIGQFLGMLVADAMSSKQDR